MPWVAFTKMVGLSRLFPRSKLFGRYNLTYLDPEKTVEVEAISGSFMVVRRQVVEEVGLLDEEFFLYFEDIDLCMRIGQEGWRLTVVPESRIFHAGGASTSALSLKSRYFYRQSQLRYYHKHNSRTSRALLRIFLRLDFVRLALAGWLSRKADMDIRREFFGLLKED